MSFSDDLKKIAAAKQKQNDEARKIIGKAEQDLNHYLALANEYIVPFFHEIRSALFPSVLSLSRVVVDLHKYGYDGVPLSEIREENIKPEVVVYLYNGNVLKELRYDGPYDREGYLYQENVALWVTIGYKKPAYIDPERTPMCMCTGPQRMRDERVYEAGVSTRITLHPDWCEYPLSDPKWHEKTKVDIMRGLEYATDFTNYKEAQ